VAKATVETASNPEGAPDSLLSWEHLINEGLQEAHRSLATTGCDSSLVARADSSHGWNVICNAFESGKAALESLRR
jgi:hypothetical protein